MFHWLFEEGDKKMGQRTRRTESTSQANSVLAVLGIKRNTSLLEQD